MVVSAPTPTIPINHAGAMPNAAPASFFPPTVGNPMATNAASGAILDYSHAEHKEHRGTEDQDLEQGIQLQSVNQPLGSILFLLRVLRDLRGEQ
jgi:hypothetical protein